MGLGRYLSIPFLFLAVVLQTTVFPEIRIASGHPDLILMIVISWGMLAETNEGLIWAFVGGIWQDLAVGLPTGTSALALVTVVFLLDLTVGNVSRNNLFVPPAAVGVATVLYHLLLLAFLALLNRPQAVGPALIYVTLPTVLFNIVLILPVFRLMGAVYEASRPRSVEIS